MPPIPPGIAGSSLGISVTTASAVVRSEATPAASVNAVLTTCNKHPTVGNLFEYRINNFGSKNIPENAQKTCNGTGVKNVKKSNL